MRFEIGLRHRQNLSVTTHCPVKNVDQSVKVESSYSPVTFKPRSKPLRPGKLFNAPPWLGHKKHMQSQLP